MHFGVLWKPPNIAVPVGVSRARPILLYIPFYIISIGVTNCGLELGQLQRHLGVSINTKIVGL